MISPNRDAGSGISVAEAARALGVARSTVQLWLRAGAPAVAPGGCGRGHGARVDPSQLQNWRAGRLAGAGVAPGTNTRDLPRMFARALWKLYTRPAVEGRTFPSWKLHRIPQGAAAALLVDAFQLLHREAIGRFAETEELPVEMARILSVSLRYLHLRVIGEPPND